MGVTVSYPVRIAAVCGLIGAVVIGGGLTMLGRKSSSPPAPVVIKHHPFGSGVAKHLAATKAHPARSSKPAHSSASAKAPAVKVHRVVRPAIDQAAVAAGLPISVARALAQHSVVVVELYDPQSEVDAIAYAEAQAGAHDAGAAFLPLSVLGPDVSKLTQKFGEVLPDPGLLVYAQPASLALRINGFVDRDTVAQAAQNARPTGVQTVAAPTWWERVNAVCATAKMHAPVLVPPFSRTQVQDWVTQELVFEKHAVASISAIPLSTAGAERASAVTFLTLLHRSIADEEKLGRVLAAGGTFNTSLVTDDRNLSQQALGLASKMGAPACAG